MSEITSKLWNGEPVKAIIKFSNVDSTLSDYEVYMSYNSGKDKFISNLSFNFREGNSSVIPLGIGQSNTMSIKIYDIDDSLSPSNTNSVYYGKLFNGIEIDLYVAFDGVNYTKYGKWYTTSWSGSFSNGYNNEAVISCEDILNTIGGYNLPKLKTYVNISVGTLIEWVFLGCGLSANDYKVDSRLNTSVNYAIPRGTLVREFLNNVCQLLFARVIVDSNGVINIVPALELYENYNYMKLDNDTIGTLSSKLNSNVNYVKVAVKYLEKTGIFKSDIVNERGLSLGVESTNYTYDNFDNKILSVDSIYLNYDYLKYNYNIIKLDYNGYLDSVSFDIKSDGPIEEVSIYAYGTVASTKDRIVYKDINSNNVFGGQTFGFDTKQMMSKSDAEALASKLATYVYKVGKNIGMSGVPLTMKLKIGDMIIISNTDTKYNGNYKVIGINSSFGENVTSNITLLSI